MANTTSIVGRLQAVHPDLGFDGGATLEGHVKSTLTKISDAINSRFFVSRLLLDSASVNFEHNFKCAFSELRINLFLIDGGDELTRITEATTPPLSDFSIVAKVGDLTTHITVTNNTGSTQDIALVVVQGKGAEVLSDLGDCDTTGKEDGQALVYSVGSDKFVPGASGDSSFKFQKLTGTVLTIKKGYLILSTGEEIYSSADLSPDLATAIPGADGNYYGYFDRTTFPAASTVSGRKLIAMTSSQLVFSTTTPDQINLSRYVPIGKVIKSTGVFSGLETLAMRRHGLEAGLRIKAYTGTALNGLTALPGVHYIVDMSGVSADKGFVMPAGSDLARVRVSIIPPSSLYKFTITANGAETLTYGGATVLTAINFPAGAETWAEFCWNGSSWSVEDATNVIAGTLSGDIAFTGTVGIDPTKMSNVDATRLGLKQYLVGTAYNGGVTPTLSGGNYTSTNRGVIIPYQTQANIWRLRFNIDYNTSATTSADCDLSGVSWNGTSAITCMTTGLIQAYCCRNYGTNSFAVRAASGNEGRWLLSGDVELTAKPSWAY